MSESDGIGVSKANIQRITHIGEQPQQILILLGVYFSETIIYR